MRRAPFRDEEHAFRSYARAISQSGVSAVDPMAMRGVEWAEVCLNCKSDRWVKQDGAWRCAGFRCGKPRPWEVVAVPRGFFQENARRNSGNHTVERTADLGLVFAMLSMWEFRAWWAYIAINSYHGASKFCRHQWPYYARGWGHRRVMELADTARDRVRPRLLTRGLID